MLPGMTEIKTFEVRKDDLGSTRIVRCPAPSLKGGEVLARVDRFGLTANNITYAVVAEKFGYWKFFPAEDGWGVIPVWGFADVVTSNHPDVKIGERLYGYFPMGTHLVLKPAGVSTARLFDGAAHRAELPAVYNSYARVHGEPHYDPGLENERMLLLPLYATSFCLHDFLNDHNWFGAKQIIILSASSRTAIGLAIALSEDPSSPESVGLTSERNLDMVNRLGLYDHVMGYGDIPSLDATVPAVIVDMSGSGKLLSALHGHLGDNMRYCANVGVTHYDQTQMGPQFISARSATFFAPGHIQKRRSDWGPGVFEQKSFRFWRDAALRSRAWLRIEPFAGMEGLKTAYRGVLEGTSTPDRGVVVNL